MGKCIRCYNKEVWDSLAVCRWLSAIDSNRSVFARERYAAAEPKPKPGGGACNGCDRTESTMWRKGKCIET